MVDHFASATDSLGLTDSRGQVAAHRRTRTDNEGLLDSRVQKANTFKTVTSFPRVFDEAFYARVIGEYNLPADPDIPTGEVDEPEPARFAKDRVTHMSASIRQATPTQPDADSAYLRLTSAAGAQIQALLDVAHGVPLGVGARVLRAELHLFKAESWTDGGTLTAFPIVEEWDADAVTWDTVPAVEASFTGAAAVSGGGVDGDEIVVEVTSAISNLHESEEAGGAVFDGFVLAIDGTATRRLWSAFAEPDVRPYLRVEYNVPPDAPTNLSPSGGKKVSLTQPTLLFDFTDADADDTLSAVRVQVDSDPTFDSPTYDSGWVNATEGMFDLADPPTGAPAAPTFAAGTLWYWRAAVRDGRGMESDFSEVESWMRVATGSVSLTNPSGATVSSPTPTFTFTVSGATQEQVEVEVEVLENDVWVEHYTFEQEVTSATAFTLPDDYRLSDSEEYRVTVRVYDAEDREDMGSDRSFMEDSQVFSLAAPSVVGP